MTTLLEVIKHIKKDPGIYVISNVTPNVASINFAVLLVDGNGRTHQMKTDGGWSENVEVRGEIIREELKL